MKENKKKIGNKIGNKIQITNDTTKAEKSFAHGLNFYKLFWIFYIGCFAGVVIETIWCITTNGYFQSRTALILEPLNPVYGLGAVLISVCFVKMSGWKNIYIYIGSFIVGGIFEWCCSFFQEMAFGTVSWYYGKDTLGILERTSLVYCVFWGFLGIVWVRVVYPFMSNLIEKIPVKIGRILTVILVVFVIFDAVISIIACLRQSERALGEKASNKFEVFLDKHYPDERLNKIFENHVKV